MAAYQNANYKIHSTTCDKKKQTHNKTLYPNKQKITVHNVHGANLLCRLRLDFSHLNEHKIRRKIELTVCKCGSATSEAPLHFLFQCQQYQTIRLKLLNNIHNPDPAIRNLLIVLD